MTQKEELAEAKAAIEELIGKLSAASKTISTLETEKTEVSGKLENANAAIVDLNDKNAKLEGEKTELTGKVTKLSAENIKLEGEAKSADERAREIAARTGTLLPKKDPTLGDPTNPAGAKTMSRADFTNLKAGERMAFIKGGGRLSNDPD